VKFLYDWDWAGAEKEFRRALELDPNSLDAHSTFAGMLMALGRFPEALAEIGRAQERDPLSAPVQSTFGRILYRARRYDEAIPHFQQALELDPQDWGVYARLSEAYAELGRLPEALALEEKQLALQKSGPSHPARARLYALMGRRAEALKAIEEFQRRSPTGAGGQGTGELAFAYAALGDKHHALEWLEKGIERRDFMVFIKVDPKLDPLRSDPRFAALLRRMNFPQ
jgi:tetratricopeptide (TPR) repeat protein